MLEQEVDRKVEAQSSSNEAVQEEAPRRGGENFRGGSVPAPAQEPLRGGERSASEQAFGEETQEKNRDFEAETREVLDYIRSEAKKKAAEPQHIDKESMLYKRLSEHYLKDYLANPNPETGKDAVGKLSEQIDPATADQSDYWEAGAAGWNNHTVPDSIKLLSPNAPSSMGAATKVMSKENRQHLPYLDVPQMVGNPNLDTGADADVHGGGKNISQLMHWATGIKYADQDPQAMRDMFLAYEYYHLEGFDKFGEDSINDMISEDAGRIMGRQLMAGEINQDNLQQKLDEGFNESRAWVGKLIKMRQGDLDAVITSKDIVESEMWYGKLPGMVRHWGDSTIYLDLKGGMSVDDVKKGHTVQHFIDVYALIYHSDNWQKDNGKIKTSNFQESIIGGKYDKVFEKAVKGEELSGKEKMDAYMNARAPWVPGFARDAIRGMFGKKLGLDDEKKPEQEEQK
jgi:hypothetical protein